MLCHSSTSATNNTNGERLIEKYPEFVFLFQCNELRQRTQIAVVSIQALHNQENSSLTWMIHVLQVKPSFLNM